MVGWMYQKIVWARFEIGLYFHTFRLSEYTIESIIFQESTLQVNISLLGKYYFIRSENLTRL